MFGEGQSNRGVKVEDLASYNSATQSRLDSMPVDSAMSLCRDELQQGIREGFNSSAEPGGSSWPPRKQEGDGHPILIDTGRLMQAAVGNTGESIKRVGDRDVSVGVTVPYGVYHQQGTSKMPQRAFIGASEQTLDNCGEIIADAFLEAF